ncbi:hypothetical protein HDU96_006505 [Phlyctochytrium bullatum]|nr:hypothetical protein HDU96_006505 [Phlyctochytrium bullatum]
MTCDEGRPCQRCIKRKIAHLCHDEKPPATTGGNEGGSGIGGTFDPTESADLSVGPSTAASDIVAAAAAAVASGASLPPAVVAAVANALPSLSNPIIGHHPVANGPIPNVVATAALPNGAAGTGAHAANDHAAGYSFPALSGFTPLFASEHMGNEFNILTDFLASLDEMNGAANGRDRQAAPHGSLTLRDVIASDHGPTGVPASTEGLGITDPTSQLSSTEKFVLTAADPGDGSYDDRLNQVITAKFEAGLLKPYNYVNSYARLQKWMETHMSPSSRARILNVMGLFRPKFRWIAQSLTDIDLVLVEEAFERLLLEYDRVFSSMGIPSCLWRRTGEICKCNKEFASLVGLPMEKLRDGKVHIYELMSEESAVNYWEKYGNIAFDAGQKAVLTSCVLKGLDGKRNVNCCFSFTIRRDRYNIPLMALLQALGMGAATSIGLAATTNWVIKDGFGLLGGVVYAAWFGSRFDSQARRYRFLSAVTIQAATLAELLTPLVPHLFLPMASLSNIGKNVGWLAASATKASMHRGFAKGDNLGDITAKSGAQATLAGLVGTVGGVSLSWMLTYFNAGATAVSPWTMLYVFVPLSAFNLWSAYRANLSVVTRSLNVERGELALKDFVATLCRNNDVDTAGMIEQMATAHLPQPATVCADETFVMPFRSSYKTKLDIEGSIVDVLNSMTTQEANSFLSGDNQGHETNYRVYWNNSSNTVHLWFLQDSTSVDHVRGFYHACILRQLINDDAGVKSKEEIFHRAEKTTLFVAGISTRTRAKDLAYEFESRRDRSPRDRSPRDRSPRRERDDRDERDHRGGDDRDRASDDHKKNDDLDRGRDLDSKERNGDAADERNGGDDRRDDRSPERNGRDEEDDRSREDD